VDTVTDAERVVGLVERARPRCGAVTVVAVDGPSGAGKTTLANAVAAELGAGGRSVSVVHVDELVPGWDGLAATPGLVAEHILEPLSRGEPAAFRAWDWEADRWGETRPVPLAEVLVLEGCGSSARPAGDWASVRVWVEAPLARRHSRAMGRDGAVFAPHWERWAAQERELYARDGTRSRADLVVET
jgi:uridine kinase